MECHERSFYGATNTEHGTVLVFGAPGRSVFRVHRSVFTLSPPFPIRISFHYNIRNPPRPTPSVLKEMTVSYLDLPRLHFAGLFYTGPSTINNITENYIPSTPLTEPNDPTKLDPNAVLWNPNGVAQWWLEQCSVLSAIGQSGTQIAPGDQVLGATVLSPSPKTPMSDGASGFYDIAKMVDLDADQQGRSALYGVRIGVTLPNGAGFQGLMTVAELRQLNGRIAGARSSWGAVGNWMGTLQNVVWSGDLSGSPLLQALQTAGVNGLAVKLTADLHQNNPATMFTSGDMFCYGRVLGTIGPALPGELSQVVPGRCIQSYSPPPPPNAPMAMAAAAPQPAPARRAGGREVLAAKTGSMEPMPEIAPEAAQNEAPAGVSMAAAPPSPPSPWNPAFCVIRPNPSDGSGTLDLDIGGSILLATTGKGKTLAANGTFAVSTGIAVGVVNPATQQFTPFTNGALTFNGQYQPLTSTSKNCVLVANSGVFSIHLTAADMTNAAATPLAITVNGTPVAEELPSGYWMDVDAASQRLQCGGGVNGQDQIMVRQWGNAVTGVTPPVTATVSLVEWEQDATGQWGNPTPLPTSTDLGISFGTTDANGLAAVTTTINIADGTLPAIRQPLDSYVYYVTLADPQGNAIGDGPSQGSPQATVTVVLWNQFQAPANPTWADVGPIMASYARMYPGMQSLLDISDPATVQGFAPMILARMNAPVLDPAFMPVTRDLSPTKTAMVVAWLASVPPSTKASH
jgi:hypothetical protein